MAKLKEIAEHPHYDAAASGASKSTIFVFIATFGYLVFFSGTSPGIVGGAVFFVTGIFAVSLLIAMPLFLLGAKVPRLGLLISVADIAITIFVTRLVYLWLFAAPLPAFVGEPFAVHCQQPIPEFTLGLSASPSQNSVAELCSCIWNKLGTWEKETAQAISQGRQNEVSSLNLRAFPYRFGGAVRECGGMDL